MANRALWQRLATLLDRHEVRWHVVSRDSLPEQMESAKALAKDALAGRKPDNDE